MRRGGPRGAGRDDAEIILAVVDPADWVPLTPTTRLGGSCSGDGLAEVMAVEVVAEEEMVVAAAVVEALKAVSGGGRRRTGMGSGVAATTGGMTRDEWPDKSRRAMAGVARGSSWGGVTRRSVRRWLGIKRLEVGRRDVKGLEVNRLEE